MNGRAYPEPVPASLGSQWSKISSTEQRHWPSLTGLSEESLREFSWGRVLTSPHCVMANFAPRCGKRWGSLIFIPRTPKMSIEISPQFLSAGQAGSQTFLSSSVGKGQLKQNQRQGIPHPRRNTTSPQKYHIPAEGPHPRRRGVWGLSSTLTSPASPS